MNKSLLVILLIAVSHFAYADHPPERIVTDHFNGYAMGIPGAELVESYWLDEIVINSSANPPRMVTAAQYAAIVEQFRENVRSAGWQGTEILDMRSCEIRDDMAMVSVSYTRVYADRKAPDAVIYLLNKRQDGYWRISTVIPAGVDVLVACL